MIRGIGVDIVEIARLEKQVAEGRFLQRYFTPCEQAYVAGRGKAAPQSAAGIFAAKEAALKALGTGLKGMRLTEIEVEHEEGGAPRLRLLGAALERAGALGAGRWWLSISHDGGAAVAMVVLESGEAQP